MADFCKQCAEEIGFKSDFIDVKLKPGLYNTNLCEGCGPIQTNSKGECISPDCLCPGHNAPLDTNVSYWIHAESMDFKNVPHKEIEYGEWSKSILNYIEIKSIDDIPHIKGYQIYVCWEGTYNLYELI